MNKGTGIPIHASVSAMSTEAHPPKAVTTEPTKNENHSSPWMLTFYFFLITMVIGGIIRIKGLVFVAIMDENKIGRGEASWPFSLSAASGIFMAPIVGFMSVRWKPGQLATCGIFLFCASLIACYFSTNIYVLSVFLGVVFGCAGPMVVITRNVVISNEFNRHRTTAMGITSAGRSIAGFIWPPVFQLFLDKYTLRGTFLMLAGLTMHGFIGTVGLIAYKIQRPSEKPIVPKENKYSDERRPLLSESAASYKTSEGIAIPSEHRESDKLKTSSREYDERLSEGEIQSKKPKVFNIRIVKNILTCRAFYIFVLSHIIVINTSATFNQVNIDYLGDKGVPVSQALFMITSFSLGDITGNLGLGWISDKKLISRQYHTAAATVITGSTILLLTFSYNYFVLLACGFLVGMFQGSTLSVGNAQFADYLAKDELPLAFAFRRSFSGIVAVSRAPIIGYFRDELGTYDHLFWILSGALYLNAIIWIFEGIRISKKTKKKTEDDTEH